MSGQRDGRTSGFRAPPSYLVFLLPYASNTPFTTQKPHGMFSQPTRPGLQCFCRVCSLNRIKTSRIVLNHVEDDTSPLAYHSMRTPMQAST